MSFESATGGVEKKQPSSLYLGERGWKQVLNRGWFYITRGWQVKLKMCYSQETLSFSR